MLSAAHLREQRALIDAPEHALPHLVAADHDCAGRRHPQRARDPAAEEPRNALGAEDVPEQPGHVGFFGGGGGF